jgi:hypothetical protein
MTDHEAWSEQCNQPYAPRGKNAAGALIEAQLLKWRTLPNDRFASNEP